jgi:hypothetical protein
VKSSEINPIKSDSVEINCQGIYDHIIASQREFDGNLIFEKNILSTLNEIEELLFQVNDIELFGEMIDLIYRFRFRLRELESQMKFLDDESIMSSQNITFILDELSKFKEII